MNDKVAINIRDDDSVLCYDNYAVSRNSPIPIRSTLILVQPKEDHEFLETSQNTRDQNEKSTKYSNISSRSSISSNSIEELDIGVANVSSRFHSIHNFNNNSENYQRKKSINVFDEEILASYAIMNPIPGINIADPKNDLYRFLLTPPPKNVVMKCQIVKSNTIDKTLLFTNFIFSLQMSDADENFKRQLQYLMIAHPNRNPKNFAYTISTDPTILRTNPSQIVGQVKSNFIGTRFKIFCQNDNFTSDEVQNSNDSFNEDLNSYTYLKKKNGQLGVIFYKNSRFGSGKPRKLEIIIPTWNEEKENYDLNMKLPKDRKEFVDLNEDSYIKLENVNPDYDEDQKCYTVDFGGRVKEMSVKNFALTAKIGGTTKRVYQFGKCKNHYIVDFTYPLCPFQAFAIGISSLQRKIGTE